MHGLWNIQSPISKFRDVLGSDKVIIFDYDEEKLKNQNIIHSFLDFPSAKFYFQGENLSD